MKIKEDALELFGSMISAIQVRIDLKAVILFGSRAKGTAHAYSDYDLVIVGDFKEEYFARLEWVIQLASFVSVDLFYYTPQEFKIMFDEYRQTPIDAVGEGIMLFGEDWIRPYKQRYTKFVEHGMKKTDCVLIPPSL
ncbi:MAG: nucleotidyltransferase domain-containing protein [Candidatus Sigynarchaeum springense]